jgi:hypothetical protein
MLYEHLKFTLNDSEDLVYQVHLLDINIHEEIENSIYNSLNILQLLLPINGNIPNYYIFLLMDSKCFRENLILCINIIS